MICFAAPLEVWTNDEGRAHFVTVPEPFASEIKAHAMLVRRGFGSAKVEVTVNGLTWRTSVFPARSGGYFLPIKIAVVRGAALVPEAIAQIALELL